VSVAAQMNCRKKRYRNQPRCCCTVARAAAPARTVRVRRHGFVAHGYADHVQSRISACLHRILDVMLVFDEFVLELLLQIDALAAGLRQAIDGVDHEVVAAMSFNTVMSKAVVIVPSSL